MKRAKATEVTTEPPAAPVAAEEFAPTAAHILALVCSEYGVSEATARRWLESLFSVLPLTTAFSIASAVSQ